MLTFLKTNKNNNQIQSEHTELKNNKIIAWTLVNDGRQVMEMKSSYPTPYFQENKGTAYHSGTDSKNNNHWKKENRNAAIIHAVDKITGTHILHSGKSITSEKKDPNTISTVLIVPGILLLIGLIRLIIALQSAKTSINNVSKKGCFIATACYGNYDAPEVLILRKFRDNYLLKTLAGRMFVRTYYEVSPFLARSISKSERIKKMIRKYFWGPLVSRLPGKNT